MSMSSSFGGGPGLPRDPTPPAGGAVADAWGYARAGESVEQWHARESRVANAKLRGTPAEGQGVPSIQAALAYERHVWERHRAPGRV